MQHRWIVDGGRRARSVGLAMIAFWMPALFAQPQGAPPDGARRGPPAEALAACKSLDAGKACSFTVGQATMTGTCWAPQGLPLACRPKDAPEPKMR